MKKILSPFHKGNLSLKNHLVMAPMTRSRAINNLPNELMADYYEQRSGAGLIITEGTSPLANGLGYCRIPGIFSQAQIDGWKKVTDAVHKHDSKIFVQLMHTGRVAHTANLPQGCEVIGVSDIKAQGQMYTDTMGMQENSVPVALTTEAVYDVIHGFVQAAKNAVEAGFDGVEFHSANGYLLEQFLNPNVNNRTDEFGGSIANRAKFTLTAVRKAVEAIGKEKVGIRFSPFSTFNDMQPYAENDVHETYSYLAQELNKMEIAYIHIGANPAIPPRIMEAVRANFNGTIIICNGLTPESAEKIANEGIYDLVAFGRSFLSNPDFDKRIEKDAQLNQIDFGTFYTPGAKGYTDYECLKNG